MGNLEEVENNQLAKQLEKKKDTIRKTVAKGANEEELDMFLHLAKQYGLDPFQKEIFFWKYGKDPTIMTSRDGYLKIANQHKEFDGHIADVVRENDKFKKLSDGSVEHEYTLKDRGKIVGAYSLVYRKDRKVPTYIFAPYSEYKKGSKVWKQYPSAMILKVAESMSLKRAFSVSGLVSKEEIGHEQEKPDYTPTNKPEVVNNEQNDKVKSEKELYAEISQIIENKDMTKEEAKKVMQEEFEVQEIQELSNEQLSEYIELLQDYESDVIDVSSEEIAQDAAENIQ